jgi:phosphoglycerate dehydrogenase-like enzyme
VNGRPGRPVALFAMGRRHLPLLFGADAVRRLHELVDVDTGVVAEDFADPDVAGRLANAEVLLTGWDCPPIDAAVLDRAPRLRAVLHAAGTVKGFLAPECWDRGVLVSSAAAANALPVAEFTVAAILWAGKDVLGFRDRYRAERAFTPGTLYPRVGNFHRRVGIVGASHIGRRVMELLRPFDLDVALADPYASSAPPGVRLVELDELLAGSDVVSLHAPANEQTRHLLDRRRLALIPDGGVLVNTARGSLVDTDALAAELATGRISAVLDVADPEPLPTDSPLFDLPNAFLTPHIAGSQGNEIARLGNTVVDELARLLAGEPLAHEIRRSDLDRIA